MTKRNFTLLSIHKDDYETLTKQQLLAIVAEQVSNLKYDTEKARVHYNPINSTRNNNRVSLRGFLKRRHTKDAKVMAKISEKIAILRELKALHGN